MEWLDAAGLDDGGTDRRRCSLLATAVYMTTLAVDDGPEMLAATRLLARAERDTAKEKLRTLPKAERAGAKLAVALQVVFDTTAEQVDTTTGEVTEPKVAIGGRVSRPGRSAHAAPYAGPAPD